MAKILAPVSKYKNRDCFLDDFIKRYDREMPFSS